MHEAQQNELWDGEGATDWGEDVVSLENTGPCPRWMRTKVLHIEEEGVLEEALPRKISWVSKEVKRAVELGYPRRGGKILSKNCGANKRSRTKNLKKQVRRLVQTSLSSKRRC